MRQQNQKLVAYALVLKNDNWRCATHSFTNGKMFFLFSSNVRGINHIKSEHICLDCWVSPCCPLLKSIHIPPINAWILLVYFSCLTFKTSNCGPWMPAKAGEITKLRCTWIPNVAHQTPFSAINQPLEHARPKKTKEHVLDFGSLHHENIGWICGCMLVATYMSVVCLGGPIQLKHWI